MNCTRCRRPLDGEYIVVERHKRTPEQEAVRAAGGVIFSVGRVVPELPDARLCEICASFVDAAIAGRECFSQGVR